MTLRSKSLDSYVFFLFLFNLGKNERKLKGRSGRLALQYILNLMANTQIVSKNYFFKWNNFNKIIYLSIQ